MEEELNQTEQTRQSLLNPTQPDFNKALETAEAEEAAIQERQARYEANPIEEVEEIPRSALPNLSSRMQKRSGIHMTSSKKRVVLMNGI